MSLIFARLRLPVAPALLLGGFLVGPHCLGLISDEAAVETIANLGLTFLLFVIGLELDVRALAKSARSLAGAALLQVPVTIGLAFGIFWVLQRAGVLEAGSYVPLYLAFGCAFSSTLLVAQQLGSRCQMDTIDGRLALGLLIFQDIWAIVLLAVQPSFSNPDVAVIVGTLLGIVVLAGIAVFVTRTLLVRTLVHVAKQPELLVLMALGWCFGVGLLGANLSRVVQVFNINLHVDVSMEMGALIAGTTLASSPYAHDMVGKVANLRDFFVTLFFAAIGMNLPLPESATPIIAAALFSVVLIVTRPLIFAPLFVQGKVPRRHAFTTSIKLAQASEFSLVVMHLGVGMGHISAATQSSVSFSFVALAFGTAFAFEHADNMYGMVSRFLPGKDREEHGNHNHHDREPAKLVLLGFHRLGSALLQQITAQHPKLTSATLVVDFNVALHERIRATGAQVVYADLASPEVFNHLAVADDAVVISTVPDELLRGITNQQIVARLRARMPAAKIFAVALRPADVAAIKEAGADFVYLWQVEASLSLLPLLVASTNGHVVDAVLERQLHTGPMGAPAELLD